jgi:hypothetical protein
MAAQYDELGNYLGDWETEEERKKREEELANTAVRTQEIKTYGDGTVERVTKEEMPGGGVMAPAVQQVAIQPTAAVQPVQRTAVSQPVAPISPDTFARMQQAESGNRDFDAQGRPLTSSAGAMFRNQVMPSTAANPGYGIRPAQSQTPEEYNRVGQEYFQALLKQFNGDEQKAVAAYNAGPGRVQQNIAANQGQLNPAQLPRETQGYMDKVLGGVGRVVNAVMPSAQAGTLPAGQAQQAPTITAPQTRTAINPETGETYQQLMPVAPGAASAPAQAAGAPAAQPAPNSYDEFGTPVYSERQATLDKYTSALTQGQGNLGALDAIRSDTNAPEWIRTTAGEQAYDLMSQEVKNKQAQQQAKELATGAAMGDRKAANTIAKELQNQDGSYLKMILLGFISPQLAGEEAIKLGYGNKWVQGTDENGKQALLQVNAKGLPLKGYTADGNSIASNDLVAYTTGGAKVTTSGTFFQSPSGQILRAQSDEQGKTRLVDAATGARYTGPTNGLTKLEEAGAIRKMDRGLVIDLAKKHGNNVLDAEKEYVNLNGPFKSPEERQQFRQAYGYGLAQPAAVPGVAGFPGQAPAQAAPASAQAPQAPAAVPGVPAGQTVGPAIPGSPAVTGAIPSAPAAGVPTGAPSAITRPIAEQKEERDIGKEGRTDVVKKASDVVANAPAFLDQLDIVNQGISLTKKPNNLGTIAQGTIPGERLAGKVFSTEDQRNTDNIMQAVKTVAAQGMKVLGANPTDADRDYLTANIPDETWSQEAVRDWLTTRRDFLKRKIDVAKKQVETNGRYMPEVSSTDSAPLNARDQQALEWANAHPNDPRAKQIKQRLGR